MADQDVASATIAGLKEAGIDFVASVPSTVFSMVIPVVGGIGVCAGARLGGKRPALLAENSGLLVASYALRSLENFGGVPLLLLLDHRGVFGEGDGYWYFSTGRARCRSFKRCTSRSRSSTIRRALPKPSSMARRRSRPRAGRPWCCWARE